MFLFLIFFIFEECIGKKLFFFVFLFFIYLVFDCEWCGILEFVKSLDRKGFVYKYCWNGKKRVFLLDMKVWCRMCCCVVFWWDCYCVWFRCREMMNIGFCGLIWLGRNFVVVVIGYW